MDGKRLGRWIFLRGLVRESAHWDDFPQRFAEAIPNAGLILADLPGNGRHWRLPSPTSMRAMMEFARQDVLAESAKHPPAPLYLFAISLGGMVALEWLNRYPVEIAGAVLINTSLKSLSPIHQRLCWRIWPELLETALERKVEAREQSILALTSHTAVDDRKVIQTRAEAYRRHPIRRANLLRQLWTAARYDPPATKPATPLLLLNSLGDRLVDPRCSQAIADAWQVRLDTHPWAGHDLPLDDPAWVIERVQEFFGENR